MSREFDFIKACDCFYVLTVDNGDPVGRPFGAMMEVDGNLYISTGKNKAVYHQLVEHGRIQLLAKKPDSREWLRIHGSAFECEDIRMKRRMLDEIPRLLDRFQSVDDPNYSLFKIEILKSEFK